MRYQGKVWRHIPAGGFSLHAGYILKASGRWNRAGVYGCIYTSLTQPGAIAEYQKYLHFAGITDPNLVKPREIVSIIVDIDPVMDLLDKKASPIPVNSRFLTGDNPSDIVSCRLLADYLRSEGYSGIIAPSAAADDEKNLIIYIDGPAENVELEDGGDRIPILHALE